MIKKVLTTITCLFFTASIFAQVNAVAGPMTKADSIVYLTPIRTELDTMPVKIVIFKEGPLTGIRGRLITHSYVYQNDVRRPYERYIETMTGLKLDPNNIVWIKEEEN